MLTVDSHVHVVAADRARYPLTPLQGRLGAWVEAKPVDAAALLAEMDAAGVDCALLSQAATAYAYENAYVVDSAKRYPQRFIGVCIIDMLAPDAPDRLSQLVEQQGVRGIRLFTTPDPDAPWLDDPRTFPVWDRTRSLALPLMVQVHTRHLPRLRRVLELFPEIPVALDHLANGQLEATEGPADELLALADLPNLFAKFSTVNLYAVEATGRSVQSYFGPLLERFGAERLLWGSNYPNTYDRSYKEMVDLAREAFSFLDARERDWLFGGTAARLWPELLTATPSR